MTRRIGVLAVALALLLAGACGEGEEPVNAGSTGGGGSGLGNAASLDGRTFLSTGVTGHTLVEGTRIRLTFSDGTAGVSAGCNSMSGTVTIEDDRLVVSEMAGTEMGCEPALHDQDAWLAEFLGSDPSYQLTGDDLRLESGTAVIQLVDRETADPDRPLEGTSWELDGLIEGEAVGSIPTDSGATMTFSDGRVSVKVQGCNEMGGVVLVAEDTLTFETLDMTLMKCEGGPATVEEAVLAVLQSEVGYHIEAASLTLNHPEGKGLMLRAEG